VSTGDVANCFLSLQLTVARIAEPPTVVKSTLPVTKAATPVLSAEAPGAGQQKQNRETHRRHERGENLAGDTQTRSLRVKLGKTVPPRLGLLRRRSAGWLPSRHPNK
jgi:hypothetical protein